METVVRAGDRVRSGDLNLGKVALYQLSYSRNSNILSTVFTYGLFPITCCRALQSRNLNIVY